MFVSTQAIPQIAQEYLSEVILPKMPTPLGQFGLGFVLPYVGTGVQSRLAAMMPALTMLGIVDGNGKIDLEKARTAAVQALEKAGGKLPVAGYNADRADIDALFQIAQRHATNE